MSVTGPKYNASELVHGNVAAGRGEKVALIEAGGAGRTLTYAALAERTNRAGNALLALGVEPEQRVLMAMLDTIDFPAVFFGALAIGAIPVPVNTLLTTADYDYLLRDSRARALVVSGALLARFAPILADQPFLRHVVVADPGPDAELGERRRDLAALLDAASPALEPAPTGPDDVAFWLYSSGSTGRPKGAIHLHSHLRTTAELFGQGVLGIRTDDVVFSSPKLFFAYGLGNALSFPLAVGATTILSADRPTPKGVLAILAEHQPTIYYGVPTLYASLLADPESEGARGMARLRRCVSAGEALPEHIAAEWERRYGVHIIDGLGSTEMLHIFLADGRPVPGYRLAVVDHEAHPLPKGELGELQVAGPTSAIAYWNQREKSRRTFRGPWTLTGDQYVERDDGTFGYSGRADDMIKASGQWVSPAEVEAALMTHPSVLEAAVVAAEDEHHLLKPKAFVVPKPGVAHGEALAEELKAWVKARLAPYKYPRWIELLDALPKTATGKIQRFKLREGNK